MLRTLMSHSSVNNAALQTFCVYSYLLRRISIRLINQRIRSVHVANADDVSSNGYDSAG